MMLLKSLEREYPILDANFHQFCASQNIYAGSFCFSLSLCYTHAPPTHLRARTSCGGTSAVRAILTIFRGYGELIFLIYGIPVEDFLVHDLYVLSALAERHATAKELKQGITQVLSILDNQHLSWVSGADLLEDAKENKHVVATGCEGIDLLLQGGLREGQLTELVGPSSSGKTQVCLHAASHVALKYKGAVVFFDTCNSFSSKRIAEIVSYHLNSSFEEVNKSGLSGVMSDILCLSVFDIYSLLDGLQQLEWKLSTQVKNEYLRTRLLIVDSISSLITPVLGGGGPHGHSLMVSVGFLLKKLANEHNLSVLVTNHMVSGGGGMTKPALGESWKSVPHVRLLLSRDHGSNFYNASVLKHTCMASGEVGRFAI